MINGDYENLYNCSLKSPVIRCFLETAVNEEPKNTKSIKTQAKLLTIVSEDTISHTHTHTHLGFNPSCELYTRGFKMPMMLCTCHCSSKHEVQPVIYANN